MGVAAVLLAGTTGLLAQDVCTQFTMAPPVGSWASYRGMGSAWTISLVGTEELNGTTHNWFELDMAGAEQPTIMKILMPGGFYQLGQVKPAAIIMKVGGQPAMKMSDAMMDMVVQNMGSNPANDIMASCASARELGTESVTVAGGSFRAMHYAFAGAEPGEAWLSKKVPFGLVKWQGADGKAVELVALGTDATTKITGTPIQMP